MKRLFFASNSLLGLRMGLMRMVKWPLNQQKRKPKYIWLGKMKITDWVSASHVMGTWASSQNSLCFYTFDMFHSKKLKKKEGNTGLWVVLAQFCLCCSELARLPTTIRTPGHLTRTLRDCRGHCVKILQPQQAKEAGGPPDRTWPPYEYPLWVSRSLYSVFKWRPNI